VADIVQNKKPEKPLHNDTQKTNKLYSTKPNNFLISPIPCYNNTRLRKLVTRLYFIFSEVPHPGSRTPSATPLSRRISRLQLGNRATNSSFLSKRYKFATFLIAWHFFTFQKFSQMSIFVPIMKTVAVFNGQLETASDVICNDVTQCYLEDLAGGASCFVVGEVFQWSGVSTSDSWTL
jgi:hypothetical protein